MGKHKPIFAPEADCGDYVVVTNARDILLTGKKSTEKVYYSHTGYPGGLKITPITKLFKDDPTEVSFISKGR